VVRGIKSIGLSAGTRKHRLSPRSARVRSSERAVCISHFPWRLAWGPTEGVSTGMSAYTTPVRDGAGHMVMAPTPPTNIRNLIAQKEKVRV
jgi:hypothetical protein